MLAHMRQPIPPFPEEDHACHECGVDYRATDVAAALGALRALMRPVRQLVVSVSDRELRRRPAEGTWSMIEYLCHLRDVYAVYTIRLYRTRVEERPVLEPMLNDLRAARFRYNNRRVEPVLEELEANLEGFFDEVDRVRDEGWDRVALRRPDEVRTARWMVRQAMHEGVHHLRDLSRIARAARSGTPVPQ